MSFRRRDRISIFGALRPAEGQTVSRAVVATYSLDLIALLGLVLALGGDGEAEFENSPLELVEAFDRMRGRLLVLHQLGRVIAPRAHRSVLPLLDTMLCAIEANERTESWHPKVALVRYEGGDGVQWRFWIGSRNLTGAADLDAGLLLVSSKGRGARPIPDIALLAEDLLGKAAFSPAELGELQSARWAAPAGVKVRSLLWRQPGAMRPFIGAPLLPRAEKASAVSPFIDRMGLGEVVKAAGSEGITLLTTDMAASRSSPATGIAFRTGTPPEPETSVSVEQQQGETVGEFTELPPTGVHAKLIAMTRGKRTALMIGSANLTKRGLVGPNAEAVALLDIDDPALSDSLHAFVAGGFEFDGAAPDPELVAQEKAARQLDEHISRFLECELRLVYDGAGLLLLIGEGCEEPLKHARFAVSPFLDPEAWIALAPGVRSVRLLERPPALSEQTSLVTFRAVSADDAGISRSWVLSLRVDGLDEERRDRALLARYVGAGRFRDWLRSRLDGIDGTAGECWSDPQPTGVRRGDGARFAAMFTLETMLSAWASDQAAFERRIAGIMAMLESFRETFESWPDEEERRAALDDLAEVRPFLQALHDAIHGAA
ncbi:MULTISPECIES: hypothetical protein [Sphingobium]|uniref:hypothetical protein n=1 Tax=Sphingobium TaxID=165695 RepID=UPI00159CC1A8|nr:hypothetical protein [Sphingobium sp. 15-1]